MIVGPIRFHNAIATTFAWVVRSGVGGRNFLYMTMQPSYKLVMALTLDDFGKYTTRALRALEVYFP